MTEVTPYSPQKSGLLIFSCFTGTAQARSFFFYPLFTSFQHANSITNRFFIGFPAVFVHLGFIFLFVGQTAGAADTAANTGHPLDKIPGQNIFGSFQQCHPAGLDSVAGYGFGFKIQILLLQRRQVNLMIGPPTDPADDEKMMGLFFSKEGKHIVCGGTTSTVAARFLHKTVQPNLGYLDPEIPPTATIEGVDLVTEGVITINRVLSYAKSYLEDNQEYSKWSYKQDGASQIARLLFEEATDINFYVGRAVNPAHQNPDLPINFSIKMRLVDELSDSLKQMGKRIKVSYF